MLSRQNSSRPYTSGSFRTKLELFDKFIKEFTYVDEELNPEERRQILQDRLTNGYEPFCEAIRNLFGNDVSTQDLKALFRKIALNPDAKVDWSELFGIGGPTDEVPDLLLNEDTSSVLTTSKRKTVAEAGDKKRRDIVQSILHVPKYDFYITASQKGIICQWSNKFRLQACTDIMESSWVTGCGFLPSLRRIVATSERAIALWDYRAKRKQSTIYQIKPMENSPQCMTYIPWKANSMNEDTILFGDDQGYVNILTISSKDLHMKNSSAKGDSAVVTIEPNKLSSEIKRRKFFDDWVLKIKYFPQLEMFGCCSPGSSCSFILGGVDRVLNNGPVRELGVPKGVNCFDYCTRANVIVTAGADKIVRIWHPLIFTRPTGKLLGHLFTIVEIAVNEKDQQLISLSTARVFRVWDLQTLTCLQVFTDNEERPGEKRISAMLFDAKHDRLITGCSVIDTWPLTRAIQDSLQVPHTHDRPISQLLYNPQMNQVISVCTEGVMKVWEMETGQMVYQVTDAHGTSNEVTAMNVDNTGYRLITGAYDGSIKAWDFGSGQLYKKYPDEPAKKRQENTITGLVYHTVDNKRCVLVSSWGQGITLLEDCYDLPMFSELRVFSDLYIPQSPASEPEGATPFISRVTLPDINQKSSTPVATHALSTCEVTCMEEFGDSALFAGTSDGNIIMWNLQTEKIITRFDLPPLSRSSRSGRSKRQRQDERLVHACRVMVHRVRRPIIYGETKHAIHTLLEESEADETEENDAAIEVSASDELKENGDKADKNNGDDENRDESDSSDTNKDVEMKEEGFEKGVEGEKEGDEDGSGMEEGGQPEDEDSPFIRISDPALVSAHHDGYLRFWTLSGRLLTEIRAVTRRQASAVTSLCTDADCRHVISGDAKGYVTVWDVGSFLLDPPKDKPPPDDEMTEKKKEPKNVIKQVVCWRAHLTRVVGVEHVDSADAVVTSSTDLSVRVWYRDTGHFIGFFGQPRLWHLPSAKSVPSTPVRPYDITESPIKALKNLASKSKHKPESTVDCPLMFDDNRWHPFRHSAQQETKPKPGNMKFFDSLSKPKHYNSHLQSSRTGSPETGAVFRALPVYRVDSPERLTTPAVAHQSSWLTNHQSGAQVKAQGKTNYTYRSSPPTKEHIVSRFPHLVQANKR
ncbi:WD repeat-containing protein 64-like isoform X2 [Nematostella vectensis]|uniref:WD repeat-containing protein 64-like isoform X2 n=1 Tax=Nematostella vectensis TaxID=45351 RepID=UPI002076EEC3|nr:WD repeat-containing protein 64-like isoform X2 [Nematostella vectensis]